MNQLHARQTLHLPTILSPAPLLTHTGSSKVEGNHTCLVSCAVGVRGLVTSFKYRVGVVVVVVVKDLQLIKGQHAKNPVVDNSIRQKLKLIH